MKKKAIVLGLDGLEPSIVEPMMERGELPAFSRLRGMGCYERLATTYPAQTPVAWSSFSTGTNPGGHGVFDFVTRDPSTYLPDFALTRFEKPKNMFLPPRVRNQRRGEPFWNLLAAAGVPATVLRCPCTFPPDEMRGHMLSGVGVPDLRGSQGTGTFYTQEKAAQAKESEQLVPLDSTGGSLFTYLIGPRNTRENPPVDAHAEIRVEVDRAAGRLRVDTGGAPAMVELTPREWSPWVRVKFKISALQSVHGQVRLYLRALAPHVEFYVSPVNFDPSAPLFPVSWPGGYAEELAAEIGPFSTLGMAEDHTALNNGRIDEAGYLAQCALVLGERERMMDRELARFREGLFFMVFDTPDRVQHMFWRFRDIAHPFHNPDATREFARQIEEHYRQYDGVLARVLERADAETFLVVLSDHGFGTFRRAVHINTWLWQQGLLALKGDRKPDEALGDGFSQVDWSRTHAYAVGLSGIYLNKRGREREGILREDGDAERVRTAIVEGLTGLADPTASCTAIQSVSRAEEIYFGAYAGEAPDLVVNYAPGYRVSWQTALGGMPHGVFEDNLRRWSGDHIIDPLAVPGILLMNRAAVRGPADIRDLAPTILAHFGVAPHPAMEGKSLLG
ncbi:MAG TPA: alkaline phosphatase family protein [Candidatus Acidoferrales bacterium]|nr:alkaline phosphatase family protein [Candidatus Acidoferrales bacterium]